ncbi:MAG: bifunctional DNA-formamidopyrimidine glycosylase/DNA-(apurinic or apyrimidinic site) lyase [Bryobacteraceae bacterium]
MPELPEVETVRRRLKDLLCGKEICEVDLRCARLRFPVPAGLTELLSHSRVSAVGRQGKYLLIHLDRGTWLVHLGMSGRFLFGTATNVKDEKHDHLVLQMSGGLTVRYNDFRRFGSFAVCSSEALATHPALSRLGIDALSTEVNGEVLFKLLTNKKTPIKTSLLNQGLISGIGNMYACEILYWSDIHPTRPSCSLSRTETHKLARAIHNVLKAAVESGGATLPDYAGTSGALGSFQHHFAVFGRHGFPCPRCEVPCVSKAPLSGRTTYYCPTQQR